MDTLETLSQEMPAGKMPEAAPAKNRLANNSNIDLLMDVSLRVAVELGRTRMMLAQVLELQHGSVVELDRLAGDPVDVYVNDCMVARGEVVIVDDKFGVRITEMVSSKTEKAAA
jgi:flagellar motor switch protein FliN/FliY